MSLKFKIIFLICFSFCQSIFAQDSIVASYHFQKIKVQDSVSQTIITHSYYTIGYFEKYRIPLWTYYSSTKETMLQCLLDRKGSFRADPLVNLIQANKDDYEMPFEKGHLVPCEPMTFSEKAMKETFYYTNCVPQYEKVNSGRWRTLEKLVNNWAIDLLEVMVFTGNVVDEKSQRRGPHNVTIPDYCFKIILAYRGANIQAIAFMVPNKDNKLIALENYIVSIDKIEEMTGFDFFADLPLADQEKFESSSDTKQWDWRVGKYDKLFKALKAQR